MGHLVLGQCRDPPLATKGLGQEICRSAWVKFVRTGILDFQVKRKGEVGWIEPNNGQTRCPASLRKRRTKIILKTRQKTNNRYKKMDTKASEKESVVIIVLCSASPSTFYVTPPVTQHQDLEAPVASELRRNRVAVHVRLRRHARSRNSSCETEQQQDNNFPYPGPWVIINIPKPGFITGASSACSRWTVFVDNSFTCLSNAATWQLCLSPPDPRKQEDDIPCQQLIVEPEFCTAYRSRSNRAATTAPPQCRLAASQSRQTRLPQNTPCCQYPRSNQAALRLPPWN